MSIGIGGWAVGVLGSSFEIAKNDKKLPNKLEKYFIHI